MLAIPEYYNDRAERQFGSPWGPKFSETSAFDIVKQPVTDGEIREWQQLNEPLIVDRESKNSRRRAQDNIRRERFLDEDAFNNMQIDDDDIESLNAKVLMALSKVNDSEAAAERLLETKSSGTDKLVSAKDFICALSKINILNNLLFARAWQRYCKGSTSFHDSTGQHSMTGNSRDDPTPIEHSCKKTKGSSQSEVTWLPTMKSAAMKHMLERSTSRTTWTKNSPVRGMDAPGLLSHEILAIKIIGVLL